MENLLVFFFMAPARVNGQVRERLGSIQPPSTGFRVPVSELGIEQLLWNQGDCVSVCE